MLESRPLLRGPELVHPDLSEISTSICDMDGVPAVQFGTGHPYATGFVLDDGAGNRCCLGLSDRAALDAPPGEHSWRVSTRTPFGTVGASTLSYVTRSR